MNHHPSAQDQPAKNWQQYIAGLTESTRPCGGEEIIHCHACGTWIETALAQFSRYDGEPMCAGCAESEARGD